MNLGQRYRVITKASGTIKAREMVASYLGETNDSYSFNLRPLAGTQDIRKSEVFAIYTTTDKLMLPRIFRPERRVL